ncbi:MAG: chitin-binding protein [Anaerolineaceae bacterium]|nr:chitin-binding protein [Anaerolineaceae bacterium]
MKTVVITGSTRGIGFGMAKEFLRRGHQVVVSGRSDSSVADALAELGKEIKPEMLGGFACDMADYGQVDNLWKFSENLFGKIDIWINNAGISHQSANFSDIPYEVFSTVIQTNLIGVMNGVQIALQQMKKQGFGFIYNMEGLGSDGRITPGLSIYGTSKRALSYFTESVVKENEESPVKIGFLSPGMVVTDLLLGDMDQRGEKWQRQKKIFNILADRVETVTPYLVEQILENEKHGAKIAWLTTPKIIWRFLTAPIIKRDIL